MILLIKGAWKHANPATKEISPPPPENAGLYELVTTKNKTNLR
jgi:hypothetical protein